MLGFGKVLAILIVMAISLVMFGKWIFIPVGFIILLFLIRIGADIFWYFKDR